MDPEPSFEDALKRLEQIVDALERGEPELSAALAKYEQGVHLLAHCQSVLERAERSVALLTGVDSAGNPVTAPFDATATMTTIANAPAETETDPALRPKPKPSPRKRPASPPAVDDDDLAPF
jgi:exodeoxyribonuclease VII small subunit